MTGRAAIFLSSLAFLAMAAAMVWLFHEMSSAPEVPVMIERGGMPARHAAAPQTRAVVDAGQPADAAATAQQADLAAELADGLARPDALPGEALLGFKSAEALAAFRARAAQNGLEVISHDPTLLSVRLRFKDLGALREELAAHRGDITHAGPNLIARIPGLPAQPQTDTNNAGGSAPFRSQGLDLIGAPASRAGWGKGTTVAVLDSGVLDHPALQNVSVTHLDLVNDGQPFHGHGTAMASLIAGSDGQVGGISPGTTILDVRVADPQGNSNTALLAEGIMRAVGAGAQVINISLGSMQSSPVLEQAVQHALARGVVIVAAAGNEQANALSFPAGLPGVVSVGAVDATGTQAWFSNSGRGLTLAAPGVGIVSAYADGKLVIGSGTSQAAAIVSGTAAYLLGKGYQGVNVPTVLARSARPTGAPQTAVGAGILRIP